MNRYINSLYLSGTRETSYNNGKNTLLFQFIRKAVKWTAVIIEGFHSCLFHIQFTQTYF